MNELDLLVIYNENFVFTINPQLLNKQKCWKNLNAIKDAFLLKLVIFDLISETDNRKDLKSLVLDLREIEYHLQSLWKYPEDARFHRFWEYPKCSCPKLDNINSYPYIQYTSLFCPLHRSDN